MTKSLLVVVDMQNDFIDGALGTKEAESIVPNVVSKIRSWEGEIIATKDTHEINYMHTREGRFLPVPHCIKGTDGWNIRTEVQNALNEKNAIILEKQSFGSIELPKLIEKKSYEKICFIGLCTDVCVISNALIVKIIFPEMDIEVDESCCAGVTKLKHDEAIDVMRSCQVEISGGSAAQSNK
ncbi:MAG: cysteine hydrolase [Clostridia bacterium]|nr:cysteine hydrolase [Clostridia bacterium]